MITISHPTNKWLLAMRNYTLLLGLILTICTSIFGELPPVKQWAARYNGPSNSDDRYEEPYK